ncbi:MAG: NADH-quinone oxidoreductase subunit N [Bacteroidetes bacterium]|nr:NADH-quinone oxidoreductase subunit N [Bacteroidota bacterium]
MTLDFFRLMYPELSLILIIFTLLIIKIFDLFKQNQSLISFFNAIFNFYFASLLFSININSGELFNGMYISSSKFAFEKLILTSGTLLILLNSAVWLKNHKHLPEFYLLLVSSLLGMQYMISSGNFLMFYLGLELASIPLAALVNFDLEKKKSSEAAMKMILLSAFASGIMLFGISLIYGTSGSLDFDILQTSINANKLNIIALIFIFSGFAFKISAVPFHFWTADVYEGAPFAITAFLSTISKAVIVFVFISVLSPIFNNLQFLWSNLLLIIIPLTIFIANIFALRQRNIKRFIAFSSIAQAGYILLGLSSNNGLGFASSIFFVIIYLLSNIGFFAVVSAVSDSMGKEEIDDYKGFYKNNKKLSWALAISLFSLAGIPPTAGFFGKIFLITAGAATNHILLIAFVALNMVISLFYYLNIVKKVFVDSSQAPLADVKTGLSAKVSLIICLAGIIIIGLNGALLEYITKLINL